MKKTKSFTLFILAGIFLLPGLLAYQFYRHPYWLSSSSVNKGRLLTPEWVELDTKTKWHLVLWYPKHCRHQCITVMDELARIRLALGRRLYQVETLLLNNDRHALPHALIKRWKDDDIHVSSVTEKRQNLTEHPQIFIANPEGYLVLAYDLQANPGDIFHDIQQLLRTTKG